MRHAQEHAVIKKLFPKILTTAEKFFGKTKHIQSKTSATDIYTEADTSLDTLITRTITKAFPKDIVVSEESTPHLLNALQSGKRGWIIDPICGSQNFARHIPFFCTNIAFVEKGHVHAAWVVDHPNKQLIWSTGDHKVYIGGRLQQPYTVKNENWRINIDPGYWPLVAESVKKKYLTLTKLLGLDERIYTTALGSSLAFAYVATGQMQGTMLLKAHPWDMVAACFLVEQNNGVASHFDGSPWNIHSTHMVMGHNKALYQHLINLLKKAQLTQSV